MLKSKKILVFLLVLSIVSLFSVSAFAMPGGMPAAHGLTGREFGAAISELAKSEPGAVAAHIAEMQEMYPELDDEELEKVEIELEEVEIEEEGEGSMALGKPALHGLTGREFGKAVSAKARYMPGAVAAHVASRVRMPV